MLKEAVPYDFGGIDVIDELTVAPPKRNDSKKSKEEEKPESTTPSTVSGPEEPSLTNVVTAAEDFIKVLATVSTSQSSTTTDSDKGETQSSEKKKRKNTGKKKKTTKKEKGKGKGRNRKQKAETSVRIEEGGAVSPSGSKAEELALSNFISESHKHNQSSRHRYRVDDSEYELGRQEEPSNEVMKDEPAMDKETASITSQSAVQRKPAESDSDAVPTSTRIAVVNPHKDKNRRLRKSRRKKSKPQDTNTTYNFSVISVPSVTTSPTAQSEQHSIGSDTERPPVLSAVSGPIVIPKVKKNRSKEREDREGRKKRRKSEVSSVSPIVAADHKNSSADNMNTIPPTGAPTVPLAPTAEQQVSHWLDINGGKMTIHTALKSSFSILKRQRLKERGFRSRRRKIVLPPSSENPLFHNSSENLLLVPTSSAHSVANAAAMSRLTDKPETHGFLLTTETPSISTNPHRHTTRQQRKPGKKVVPAALSDGVSTPTQTEHSHLTFAARTSEELSLHTSGKPDMTTTATPIMGPIQLSIERAKAQFTRKKRKKAALSVRRQ